MPEVSEAEAEDWLQSYGHGWKSGDVAALLQLFAPDASYHETPFEPPMVGHDAIGRYWKEGAADGQCDVAFTATLWAVRDNACFAHWRASFTRIPAGTKVQLDGAFHLNFTRNASGALLCKTLREWWHRA
jgi:ketosteroid isomerase-like protein